MGFGFGVRLLLVLLAQHCMMSPADGNASPAGVTLTAPAQLWVDENKTAHGVLHYQVSEPWVEQWNPSLKVCIWGDFLDPGTGAQRAASGPFCFAEPQGAVNMQALGAGLHVLSAAVVQDRSADGETMLELSAERARHTLRVDVKRDFAPTYAWQPVREWQGVPPGLEVRLPLDGSGERTARIPQPWQLQLFVQDPHLPGDGFFFRQQITGGTTVGDLRQAIASHREVQLPLELVWMTLGGAPVADHETVKELDLFNRQKELKLVFGSALG
ncbi:hypothetical protein JKP88DRAFT_194442 [Tribonema minus]|uniref:Uncharacterized protein n=1 Tax=Tribonema minus TaxID=303371 RepID=A0A836CHB5_9STRA|nr:hypothetical protein JKP88DRAFT_194442 [Tribonema minus]